MKFFFRSPLSLFASCIWNICERFKIQCPFAPVVFGWMIGAKRIKLKGRQAMMQTLIELEKMHQEILDAAKGVVDDGAQGCGRMAAWMKDEAAIIKNAIDCVKELDRKYRDEDE